MSSLIQSPSQKTMTSRQIAETVGSDHHNVMSTIRNHVKAGVISGNETPYVHQQNGQTYTEFNLSYRDTMVVASGYSVAMRAKIIDRWLELESAAPAPRVLTPGEMFLANAQAMVAVEKVQAEHTAQIAIQGEAIKRLESNQAALTGPQSFTALGYSVSRHLQLSSIELNKLGRKAATISKRLGLTVDKVNDVRFGMVNAYHVSALDAAIEEMLK